jgi:cytochrome c556
MNARFLVVLAAGLLAASAAFSASPDYTRKRAVYDNLGRLRGQNAIALKGGLEHQAAHSKAWNAALQAASKEFGEDHACSKVAHFSRAAWNHMVWASTKISAQDISAAGNFGYQAGEWAGQCYDEIEKLDAPTAKR